MDSSHFTPRHPTALFQRYFRLALMLSKGALHRRCAQAQFNLSFLKVDCKTQDILGTSWPEEN